jgi:hypothetical protein
MQIFQGKDEKLTLSDPQCRRGNQQGRFPLEKNLFIFIIPVNYIFYAYPFKIVK